MKLTNLTGKRYHRLVVLELLPKETNRPRKYLCLCDCGNSIIIATNGLINKRRPTKSCGCFRSEFLKSRTGKNNPNYNPNLTDEDRIGKRVSNSIYAAWAKSIYERDNFVCQICFINNRSIHAHHLDGWNWCKEKRFDLDNGVTLCKLCHNKFHKKYGNGNNTKEQFLEFKGEQCLNQKV
jgi:5-methylcytosine-specific restriction endonuclease McrA